MDEVRNDTNATKKDARVPLAKRIFNVINRHIQAAQNRDQVSMIADHVSRGGEELLDKKHLISGIACRCVTQCTRHDEDEWLLETIWENVDLSHIDGILVAGEYEWFPRNGIADRKDVRPAMIEDINAVLFRSINDWSHPEGNVWCQHIVWSGNFADGERVLQLSEGNSNTHSVTVILEIFDLYPQLREPYIRRHSTHPTAATIAAVDSSERVIISEELVGTSDGKSHGLLCAICHEVIPIGLPATQLRCRHLFHKRCIFRWFRSRLSCPLCRYELK